MPFDFLQGVVAKVRSARPELVVVTGDLITSAQQDWFSRVAELLAGFGCPTFVSFGNHDYGIYRIRPTNPQAAHGYRWSADVLERLISDQGVHVLRNRAVRITPRGDAPLWIVGLDDMWGGYFRPKVAFANIPPDQPVIALSHNPDTGPDLVSFKPGCILAGHTHGGQVRLPFVGAPIIPVHAKQFDRGMFRLDTHTRLYVSRGVGYLRKVRFLCRPELPTYVLEPEI
jgi:predicted MPP superfamily phosphohydrolase